MASSCVWLAITQNDSQWFADTLPWTVSEILLVRGAFLIVRYPYHSW